MPNDNKLGDLGADYRYRHVQQLGFVVPTGTEWSNYLIRFQKFLCCKVCSKRLFLIVVSNGTEEHETPIESQFSRVVFTKITSFIR